MKLIVGLGNPGLQYQWTKHNVGFIVIDEICKKLNIECNIKKFQGIYAKKIINNEIFYFLKPLTYMNLSGNSIREIVDYYKISIEDIIVIYDDFHIEFGRYKLKPQGSGSGHKGVSNIVENLKTNVIKQLKVGIGKDNNYLLKDWVLKQFTISEKKLLLDIVNDVSNIIINFLNGESFEKLMNRFNEWGGKNV